MPTVTRVPSVVPPGPAVALAAPEASAASRLSALAKVHYLLAYRRDTLVIEAQPPGPAVIRQHA